MSAHESFKSVFFFFGFVVQQPFVFCDCRMIVSPASIYSHLESILRIQIATKKKDTYLIDEFDMTFLSILFEIKR